MKEFKPILFSTPMVQAILEGRKTQTRRIVKEEFSVLNQFDWKNINFKNIHGNIWKVYSGVQGFNPLFKCPYEKGMTLWVRETWGLDYFGSSHFWHLKEGIKLRKGDIVYKADDENREKRFLLNQCWKPSIFMPKEAARIFLKVTNIRVERLQDISESDAISEGVGSGFQMNGGYPDYEHIINGICTLTQDSAYASFISLWQKINGNWDDTPFVWVYDFERIEKPLNFNL